VHHWAVPAARFATNADLDLLEDIENDADRLFLDRFAPEDWSPAPSGRARAAQPGFVLVIAPQDADEPVGFAHVLELEGIAHLEQLAVRLAFGRRGYGRALVDAALAEAGRRGYDRVTLRTYADVPWNAPYYRRLGFVESEPDTELLSGLVVEEARHGLERHGRRVQLTATTPRSGASPARDSVLPDHL
jgi:GNAT superfamily N-acetyltransferase